MPCRFFLLFAFFLLLFGCQPGNNQATSNAPQKKPENATEIKGAPQVTTTDENKSLRKNIEGLNGSSCETVRRGNLSLDQRQTFAIDFIPFAKSCFVTFHDPEFRDPPTGAEFYIYKNGSEVFKFPEQFNAGNTPCWVDSVGFEDINSDRLQDIIVVGKCGTKADAYFENMVYLNTGRDFVTNIKSNSEMMDFKKVGQISDFAKKNPRHFAN